MIVISYIGRGSTEKKNVLDGNMSPWKWLFFKVQGKVCQCLNPIFFFTNILNIAFLRYDKKLFLKKNILKLYISILYNTGK